MVCFDFSGDIEDETLLTMSLERSIMHHNKANHRQHHTVLTRTIMACAISHVLLGGTFAGALLTSQPAFAQAAMTRQYTIPAGTLEDALNRFGRESGILLSFSASQTSGLTTNGLQGNYAVQSGLNTLLANSGLEAVQQSNGSYLLNKVTSKDTALPVVTVQAGNSAVTEGTQSYTTRAVTLGKQQAALKDIPQSVSVVTRQQMDDQGLVSLKDAANSTTGVVGAQGVGAGMVISARGFQIDNWQYDGVSMERNSYALGNWASEDLVFYDRMEVLRGASGLFEGTGSPGGSINLVRKRGQAQPTVSVTGKAGSWNHYGLQLDAGSPLNADGSLRGRVVIDEDRSDSFIDSVWSRTRSLYAALDYDISTATTVGIGIANRYSKSRPMFVGIPRNADGSDLGLPRSTYTGSWWNRAENDQTTFFADINHRFNDRWSAKVAFVGMQENNMTVHQRLTDSPAADGSGVSYGDFAVDFKTRNLGIDAFINGAFDAIGMRHDVIVGANYSKYATDDKFARQWLGTGNIYNIDHNRPWQDYASLAASFESKSRYDIAQKGLYGSWRVSPTENLSLVAGARLSWYENVYTNLNNNRATKSDESAKVTPYAAISYALDNHWTIYSSYTSIFEPQTARNVSGQVLSPVNGTNLELGLKGELMDGRVNTSLAVFRYDHKNRSTPDYASGMVCGGGYCSQASGKVRSQGVEAEIAGQVSRGLQLIAGYTFNTTKFLEDSVNKGKVFSTWTPKHIARVWANYRFADALDKLTVGGGISMQSKTLGYDRSFNVSGFAITNARIAYQLNPEVDLALNVNNVFDKRYYIPGFNTAGSNNNYGAPRNFLFTVKYTPKL
jgi:outer membrane receptor for ferric coprogen and ferric-rhodotorulic acid